jgi:hypothetical protein
MADHGRPIAGWRETALIVVVALGASAAVSVSLGQDLNGDLLNYHFYNGYAFLNGRFDQDLAAAGPAASYLNPLLDALHYAGMERLSPKAFAALLGALQGLNALLIWAIARAVLGAQGVWLAPVAALLGATGQNAISLLGTTFADNTVSIPALAAVLAMLARERHRTARLAVAGFLGGAAVGLKLTMVAPQVGLTALAVWLAVRWRRPGLIGAFALGTLVGWAVTDGWWAAAMWSRFGNPVFPFANGVFHSPFGPARNVEDPRWPARGLLGWLAPPIDGALGIPGQLQEVPLHDPRLLGVFIALVPWLVGQLRRVRAGQDLIRNDLLVWWVPAYGAWLAVFHYYRYATVLEMLAPVLVLALLADVWPSRLRLVALAVAASLLLTTSVGSWWRTGRWSPFWFMPRIPPLGQQTDLLVLLPEESTSFMVPFFPSDAAFIGLQTPRLRGPAMTGTIAARIGAHQGPLAVLLKSWTDERTEEAIRPFGLRVAGPCERVLMGRGWRYRLCPLERPDRARAPEAPGVATSSSP